MHNILVASQWESYDIKKDLLTYIFMYFTITSCGMNIYKCMRKILQIFFLRITKWYIDIRKFVYTYYLNKQFTFKKQHEDMDDDPSKKRNVFLRKLYLFFNIPKTQSKIKNKRKFQNTALFYATVLNLILNLAEFWEISTPNYKYCAQRRQKSPRSCNIKKII